MLRKGDTADVGVDDHHHGHSIMATIRHHQITQSLIVLILLILTMPAMLIDKTIVMLWLRSDFDNVDCSGGCVGYGVR